MRVTRESVLPCVLRMSCYADMCVMRELLCCLACCDAAMHVACELLCCHARCARIAMLPCELRAGCHVVAHGLLCL